MGYDDRLSRQNLQAIVKASPTPYLILRPDAPRFTIAEVNTAYLNVTGTREQELLGRGLFEAFPVNPAAPAAAGANRLRSSLEQVLSTGTPHSLEVNRYDIPVQGTGRFEVRYWSPQNIPVLDEKGEVAFIIHTAPDITDRVRAEQSAVSASQKLQEKEGHYRSLFEHNPDAVFSFDLQGNFLSANKALARLAETSVEELLSDTFLPFVAAEDRDRVFDRFLRAADGQIQRYECGMITAKGKRRVVQVTNMPIKVDGQIVGVYGIAKDVTERRQAEQLLDKAYRLARIGAWEFDMQTNELYWSDVTKEVHGFGPDYQPDLKSTIALFKEGKHRETFSGVVHDALEHAKPFDVELKIISGQGDERWIRATGEPEYVGDECIRFYGISQNVSERKHAELNYKSLFDLSPLPKFVYDTETLRFLDVNKKTTEHYGYSREEFLAMTIRDIRPEEDIPLLEQVLEESLQTTKTHHDRAFRHRKKNGELIWVEIQSARISYNDQPARMVVVHDVTEQQQAEQALKLSEQRFRALVQDGSDLVAILDTEACYTYVSPTSQAILGISPEEFVGTCALDYIHEVDRPRVERILSEVPKARRTYIAPFRFRNAEGRWRWIETIVTNMTEDPAVGGIVANSRDVTRQMEKDQVLKKTNERLQNAQNIAQMGYWTHDVVANKSMWSEQMYKIWETDAESFTPNFENVLATVHPEDRKLFQKSPEDSFPNQNFSDTEHRIITPAGKVKWVLERITLHRDEQGRPRLLEGIAQDITERKLQQEKLRETEQKLFDVIEHSTNMFYMHTPDHQLTYVSPQSRRFLGYEPEEAMRRWTEFTTDHPINQKGIKHVEEAIRTCRPQPPYELQLRKKDGEVIWVEVNEAPVVKEGKVVAIVGSLTDITDRKNAEEELRASLQEKEVLLAEVHHRVKNNLAVVSGMMQLQAYEEPDQQLQSRLLNSVTRIQTIAGIHEHLYQSSSFSNIDLAENLKQLATHITETFRPGGEIDLDLQLQPVRLNVNQAIPVSLIVNEVLTNALKHAFKESGTGNICFCLHQKDAHIKLTITDDGVGLPKRFDEAKEKTLGLLLIDNLARQLEGDYQYISNGQGTIFTLCFDKSAVKGVGNAYL